MKYRWRLRDPLLDWRDLVEAFGLHGAIARVLAGRLRSVGEVRSYLNKDFDDLLPPERLPGAAEAAERIAKAITDGETILIHGDYDTDGVTSLALLQRNLKRLGAKRVIPYIPDRFSEGYGLSAEGVKKAKEVGASLIVTVDCGITALEEARLARELGLDLVITDHHEALAQLPEATAIVNPRLGGYPFPELAGVGVAFKVMLLLYELLGADPKPLLWDLDLVALGTVADVAPLTGENRILVEYGLKILSKTKKAGMKALKHTARLQREEITPWHISFILAPRLNAAGRLTSAYKAFELLTTQSGAEALRLAQFLERENQRRQAIEREILKGAQAKLAEQADRWFIVAYQRGWHEGVIGIVASRLVELTSRPVALISVGDEVSRGSARSIPTFHVQEALEELSDLFLDFGGHPMAAGFSLRTERIPEFSERIEEVARAKLTEVDLIPALDVDAELKLEELGIKFYKDYRKLFPVGFGNPHPVFVARGLRVRKVERNGSALKLLVDQGGIEALVTLREPDPEAQALAPGDAVDLVFTAETETPMRRGVVLLKGVDVKRVET